MYVSLSFIILEILLGLIFLAVLYFMLRGLLKKTIGRELDGIKESNSTLANYLVGKAQMEAAAERLLQEGQSPNDQEPNTNAQGNSPGSNSSPRTSPDKDHVKQQAAGQQSNPAQKRVAVEPSPEKLPLEPVDVADEFIALKNANRINAYNLRVQKIWELYKSKKINIQQYNEELVRLKKEFNIGGQSEPSGEVDGPKTDKADQIDSEKLAPVKKLASGDAKDDATKNADQNSGKHKKKSDEKGNTASAEPGSITENEPAQQGRKNEDPSAPAAQEAGTNLDAGLQQQKAARKRDDSRSDY